MATWHSRRRASWTTTTWGFPLSATERSLFAQVIAPSDLQQLQSDVHIEQDPKRGVVDVVVYDCGGQNAIGVQVTLSTADAKTQSTLPSGTFTSITENGLLYFANVPVGDVEVQAIPMATGKVSSRVSANVRGVPSRPSSCSRRRSPWANTHGPGDVAQGSHHRSRRAHVECSAGDNVDEEAAAALARLSNCSGRAAGEGVHGRASR